MNFLVSFFLSVLLSCTAFAGFQGFGGTTDLKTFNKIWCSTGLTCTKVGDKFKMISSPSLTGPLTLENGEIINNTVDDTVEILSNDEHTTLQITGFEAKNAILNLYADQGDDSADKYSLVADTSDIFHIKNNTTDLVTITAAGNVGMIGTLSGFLAPQVAATATTITAAQCGSTFSNSGAVQMELPEASTVIGCTLAFVTLNASNFDVNPNDADQILTQTNAAGDAMRNATVGNSIVIRAVSASQWAVIAVNGTWSDIN